MWTPQQAIELQQKSKREDAAAREQMINAKI